MLTSKYDVHYIIFKLSYPVAGEREYKMGVLAKTTSFMALLWCTLCFMQDRKSKNYNFIINSIDLERIL